LTFQNLLTRIPQWNPEIIKEETTRILTTSNCKYLEDLITCVHIIQLKILTYVRVGTKHKKIDLNIPKLNDFIHKIYILIARVIYQKAYLYSLEINTLERQKNNSIIETIIQDCIINAIRDSIPYELIVRSYLDETDEICEDIKEEIIKEKVSLPASSNVANKETDNTNKIYKSTSDKSQISASKTPQESSSLALGSTSSSLPSSLPLQSNINQVNNIVDNYLSELIIPTTPTTQITPSTLQTTLDNNITTPKTDNTVDNLTTTNPLFNEPNIPTPTIINNDKLLINDDMDLLLCDLPNKLNEEPSTPSLDYIELN
jgi:hypothetical protein